MISITLTSEGYEHFYEVNFIVISISCPFAMQISKEATFFVYLQVARCIPIYENVAESGPR